MNQREKNLLGPANESYQCNESRPHKAEELQDYIHFDKVPDENSTLFSSETYALTIIPKSYYEIKKPVAKIEQLHEETCFYIFYNLPGDEFQLQAYKSLIKRGFFFHVKMYCFVTFNGSRVADNSKRKITYFDYDKWVKEEAIVVFDQEFISYLKD
ncbi:hypothetical protein EDEG_03007 [Edhazardia aedis USNM 41457]|uniref:NOT2/NOT3/NOT5 C-terminal domain-containing protein n=1 Tax=Edhazardia aedis (strain USNM 41457) TaxID=1003232 RepID=J9DJ20_EDHAE|nr:hypothetical protein EDEG_03007 [Edhazardia aedis USNM 41457]|eukprot:EJW02585.1 hypothetical protein EDEG_03007 [Edhazardia aedis USNM 41457]